MSKGEHGKKRWVGKLIAFAVTIALVSTAYVYRQDIQDYIVAWRFSPDVEMRVLVDGLDLTARGERILYASRPELLGRENFNQHCSSLEDGVNILGCYVRGKVYVFDVRNEELEGMNSVTLAHEMLHAVYGRLSSSEKHKLGELVKAEYERQRTDELEERLGYYERNMSESVVDELHSIFGVEGLELSPELEAHYSKYFANRSGIAKVHRSYYERLAKLREQTNDLLDEMEELSDKIQRDKVVYESNRDTLDAKVKDFYQRLEDSYLSPEEYLRERAALQAEIDELNELYNGINKKVGEYNGLVVKYNEIALHVKELNNSIDSNFAPTPSL